MVDGEEVQDILERSEKPVKSSPHVQFSEFMSMKSTDIRTEDTMREAARKILMYHFGTMVEHEQGTMEGKDIEQLHDMRVAAMRMRSVIEVFEPYLDMDKMSKYLKHIKSIRRTLGSVRDLDVFIEKIEHYLSDKQPEVRAEIDSLIGSILIAKANSRGNMLVYLDTKRYNKFKKGFSEYLLHKRSWKTKTMMKDGKTVPCKVIDVLPILIYSQLAAVRAYEEIISNEKIVDPYLDIYHQLRIDVKILRYTIEFFREILGQEAKGLIKDLKALQDNLGDIHDTVVALDLLEKFKSFGTWGKVNKDNNSLISDIPSYQGVENYIEYRKSELDDLATRFPQMWSKVLDPYFNIRLSKAISDIYIS